MLSSMDANDYTPNFPLKLMTKDVGYAMSEGVNNGSALRMAANMKLCWGRCLAGTTFFYLCCLSYTFTFAQAGKDQVSAITTALRGREFARALQLVQPALQRSPSNAQLWTLQ